MSSTTQTRLVPELQLLPPDTVLTGPVVLTASVTPEELAERAGLPWQEVNNELGPSRVAIVELEQQKARFALTSYVDAPYGAVAVTADASVTNEEIDTLLKVLRIKKAEVLDRIDPEAFQQGSSGTEPARSRSRASVAGTRKYAKKSGKGSARALAKRQPKSGSRSKRTSSTPTRQILEIVSKQPGITKSELAKQLTLGAAELSRAVSVFEEAGKIRRKGRGLHPAGR